jgi:hypothetical protein
LNRATRLSISCLEICRFAIGSLLVPSVGDDLRGAVTLTAPRSWPELTILAILFSSMQL